MNHGLAHRHQDWFGARERGVRAADHECQGAAVGRRDAARYLPAIAESEQIDSLFEVKTVLVRSEGDDGRPILVERYSQMPGLYCILGGKVDNIYDVLERLDVEPLN